MKQSITRERLPPFQEISPLSWIALLPFRICHSSIAYLKSSLEGVAGPTVVKLGTQSETVHNSGTTSTVSRNSTTKLDCLAPVSHLSLQYRLSKIILRGSRWPNSSQTHETILRAINSTLRASVSASDRSKSYRPKTIGITSPLKNTTGHTFIQEDTLFPQRQWIDRPKGTFV